MKFALQPQQLLAPAAVFEGTSNHKLGSNSQNFHPEHLRVCLFTCKRLNRLENVLSGASVRAQLPFPASGVAIRFPHRCAADSFEQKQTFVLTSSCRHGCCRCALSVPTSDETNEVIARHRSFLQRISDPSNSLGRRKLEPCFRFYQSQFHCFHRVNFAILKSNLICVFHCVFVLLPCSC